MSPSPGERASRNVAEHLKSAALRDPDRIAVVVPGARGSADGDARITYGELDIESDALAAGLHGYGIGPGTRAVVMVRPSIDFFALVFALFKARVVPVLIDPGIGLRAIGRACRESAPAVFIGVPRAVAAQRVFGWGRSTIKRRIVVGRGRSGSLARGALALDDLRARGIEPMDENLESAVIDDDLAAILFTSGSTGPPKGARYTHAIFNAQIEAFRGLYQIEPVEIDLCTFPLFALYAPALGMTAIVPVMDPTRPGRVDPANIIEPLARYRVTNLFGSPALLRRLVEGAEKASARFPTLKRIVSAGAPASPRVLERLAPLLDPPAQIYTPYGATEALPVASIGSAEILGEARHETDLGRGVCVGRPVAGLEVAIIPIHDEAIPVWSSDLRLPVGSTGEIAVSGAVVTRGYYNRPEATLASKIVDPRTGRLYHRMGDVGRLDEQGRIWFLGRKSHRVIVGETTLFTIPCESIFNTHPDVARSALVGARRGGEVVPTICIEPTRRLDRGERARITRELLERAAAFPHTRLIKTILFHRSFPVDVRHNSKIFRERLAVWASRRLP